MAPTGCCMRSANAADPDVIKKEVRFDSKTSERDIEVDVDLSEATSSGDDSAGDDSSADAEASKAQPPALKPVVLAVRMMLRLQKAGDGEEEVNARKTHQSGKSARSSKSKASSTQKSGFFRQFSFTRQWSLRRRSSKSSLGLGEDLDTQEGQIKHLQKMLQPGEPLGNLTDFAKAYGGDEFCIRLLTKYAGNLPKACEKYKQSLRWREQHEDILTTRKFAQCGDYRVIGADNKRQPVIYMCMKNQLLPGTQCLDHQLVALLQAVDNMPPGVSKATHIWDLHGMMMRLNWNPAALGHMLQSAEGYFAERLHELIIIEMPRMASVLKDAIWPLVPEKTKEKVKFMSIPDLREYVQKTMDSRTAGLILASMDQNRDKSVSLEERKKSWTRCDKDGNMVPLMSWPR